MKLWKDTGMYLGWGLSDLILLLNPDYVVLTGGVSKARDKFLPDMYAAFKAGSIRTPFETVKVIASDNPELGSIGSALYGLEHI